MANYHRKIRCPRHFVLKQGIDVRTGMRFRPFKMMINPLLRNVPKWAFDKWKTLQRFIMQRDKFGRRIRDDNSFYQPEMSASFFVHQVYDPKNLICTMQCKGRCLEGLKIQTHKDNKRIQGFGVPSV